ncbi:hypothetical protein N7E81_12630 [Reichenbachiella carrageenanivorans]|uniref:Uncharacterized protein n=1 Tax=Reichenbachiella carrageenanivorans TaxID=2979869 RepID=A0ABY6CWV6_9BACT|nr:hypothetical protein [Reichenbachiella carrageenanivorans]UXX78204.1 hypothetical protein N7E81_12630 [Reichenbachiella carrageenanivorans]
MRIKLVKPKRRFRLEHEWSRILMWLASIVGMVWFTSIALKSQLLNFNPDDYTTRVALLKHNPHITASQDGKKVVLDRVNHTYIDISGPLEFDNGFDSDSFMNEVLAGDTITYTIRKGSSNMSGQVFAISKGDKVYMALEHLKKYDTPLYKVITSLGLVFVFVVTLQMAVNQYADVSISNGTITIQLKSTEKSL